MIGRRSPRDSRASGGWVLGWVAAVVGGMVMGSGGPALGAPAQGLGPKPTHVVVPGFELGERLKAQGVDAGELLLGELNCIACHKADEALNARLMSKAAPSLAEIGSRFTPTHLRSYLLDPHAAKPGTTMPNLFHASEAQPKAMAVEALLHYLVAAGGPIPSSDARASPATIERGAALYHSVGCVACHDPFIAPAKSGGNEFEEVKAPAITRPGVPLGDLARKTTVESLAAFLLDPLKARAAGRMPDLKLKPEDAVAIATYLLREQAPDLSDPKVAKRRIKGLQEEYFEGTWDAVPDFDRLKPRRVGVADEPRVAYAEERDNFAYRWRGFIRIPKGGEWTFSTTSDDGSVVLIDGRKVVDNDGVHGQQERTGKVKLTEGEHEIEVGFFEAGGQEGVELSWKGPDTRKARVPASAFSHIGLPMSPVGEQEFRLDARLAQQGMMMFSFIGCASCHDAVGPQAVPSRRPPAKGLAALDVEAADGCLSQTVRKGLPRYELSEAQRAALKGTLQGLKQATPALTDAQRLARTLAALNCYACHARDGVGGPEAGRDAYFTSVGHAELGDEGRLPPALSGVGAKLKGDALEGVLLRGEGVRPYMNARMPQFGKGALGELHALLAAIDDPGYVEPALAFSKEMAEAGRTLVGVKGNGCINCHTTAGRASLGVPAVDLATMFTRIKPTWFHRYLTNPVAVKPGTRMPAFWPEGRSQFPQLLGGDMKRQQEAIWQYLSLGKSMPAPAGLIDKVGAELLPVDEPIVFRTFMKNVGPRAITVGYPELVHVAFDGNQVRLAAAWRGKFFDPQGTWSGRAGGVAGALGTDLIAMPDGPAFAPLADPEAPWPAAPEGGRAEGRRFKGYRLDAQSRPVFEYEVAGVWVAEQPLPQLRAGGASLVRRFVLESEVDASQLHFVAAQGQKIEPIQGGWRVDDRLVVTLRAAPFKAWVREQGKHRQLLVATPVKGPKGRAEFEVEWSW